ncbi:dsDNA nuclease domain-containing protein [Clostridium sp. Marseille-Q7071]
MNDIKERIVKHCEEKYSGNVEEKENIIDIITTYLLNKDSNDTFSGVTATRGFFYQYLLFVYYCLECVENTDYEQVWYEIGDDITLVGRKCLEFIQVKTEKETIIDGRINCGDMTKRKKGFDSWIDKLFLQYEDFKTKMNIDSNSIKVKFKLCSNKRLSPKLYSGIEHTKYNCILDIKGIKDTINSPIKNIIENENEEKVEVLEYINVNLSEDIEWYFKNSFFETYGDRATLEDYICQKIDKIFGIYSRDLSEYCTKRFLVDALYKTSDDSKTSERERIDFCFNKEQIKQTFIKLIDRWRKETYDNFREQSITNTFQEVFVEIQEEITKSFKDKMATVMLEKLIWISCELKDAATNADQYIYERFLNRIFIVEDGIEGLIDHKKDKHYIRRTFLIIIYLLSAYDNHKIELEEEIKMLINSLWDKDENDVVIIINGRGIKDEVEIKNDVNSKSKKCKYLSKINADIDCILIDVVEDNNPFNDIFDINQSIKDYERSNDEIKSSKLEINYISSKNIENAINAIKRTPQDEKTYLKYVEQKRRIIYEKA